MKEKGRDREIRIVDRNAPRIAIQISEIRFDEKQRPATAGYPIPANSGCLELKMIGKPYAGKPHVRFDERKQDFVLWKTLNGHEAGNGGYGQGST